MSLNEIKGSCMVGWKSGLHSGTRRVYTPLLTQFQCDGKRPACSRCKGYGYKCSYSGLGRGKYDRPTEDAAEPSSGHVDDTVANLLRQAITGYEDLIQELAPRLSDSDQNHALEYVASVNRRIESFLIQAKPLSRTAVSAEWLSNPQSRAPNESQRYLGEVSDVRFFNLIKRVLQKDNANRTDDDMDSYEQDDLISSSLSPKFVSGELPSHEAAEAYLEIYFSTIHIAYPFIPKGAFMRTYKRIRETGTIEDIDITWLATLSESQRVYSLASLTYQTSYLPSVLIICHFLGLKGIPSMKISSAVLWRYRMLTVWRDQSIKCLFC